MQRLKEEEEQTALAAVARHFAGRWEAGAGRLGDAILRVGRRRVAVAITRVTATKAAAMPRLRFDRVAVRVVQALRTALAQSAPHGTTAIVTITAPIKVPAKTVAAVGERMRAALGGKGLAANLAETILGNAIRVRMLKRDAPHAARLIGFVHNRDSSADVLLDATQSLLAAIDAKAAAQAAHDERWLVLIGDDGAADVEIYRRACAQLADTSTFAKVLIVADGQRVEALIG
jgi:hypothetical protein